LSATAILILTLTEHQPAIQSYLRSHRAQKSSVEIRVESPSSLNDNLGTADVIRVAHKKGWIHGDFAVLPCDLVTTVDSQKVMEMWMVEQAGFDSDMGRRPRLSRKAGDADDGRRGGLSIWYETRGEGATKGMGMFCLFENGLLDLLNCLSQATCANSFTSRNRFHCGCAKPQGEPINLQISL